MEYDQDTYFKVVMYLEDNGEDVDDSKFEIKQDSKGVISISKWEYQTAMPDPADLNYDSADVQDEKEIQKNNKKCSHVLVVSGKNKLKRANEGDMIYNTSTDQLQIYAGGSWKSFLPVL